MTLSRVARLFKRWLKPQKKSCRHEAQIAISAKGLFPISANHCISGNCALTLSEVRQTQGHVQNLDSNFRKKDGGKEGLFTQFSPPVTMIKCHF